MKLLLLSNEFPPGPGGIGTLAYFIAKALSDKGWQVSVVTAQDYVTKNEIEQFNQIQPFGVISFSYKGPMIFEGLNRLFWTSAQIWCNRPDVLLVLGRQALWLGALVHSIFRVPLVAIGVGSEFTMGSALVQALTKWAFATAGLVIFISHFTEALAREQGYKISKATIITPGADDERFTPGLPIAALKEELGLNDSRILLTVGNVSERKAQDTVIRAMPRILKDCPNTKYLIVGLPTEREDLEKLACSLGVENQVLFSGPVGIEQLPYFYNLADVFVMVSRRTKKGEVEGFGMAVLEAALCGVPSVVSRGCGLEEAVIPNQTAFVVEPDNPLATAEAILRLLKDEALRQRMGQAARRYASSHSRKKQMDEYEIALREFVQGMVS